MSEHLSNEKIITDSSEFLNGLEPIQDPDDLEKAIIEALECSKMYY